MPHQTVATHLDAILTTEIGNTVGTCPIKLTLCRLSRFGFHVILGGHAVELFHNERLLLGIRYITLIDGNANLEIILVDVFQSLCIGNASNHSEHCRSKNSFPHKFLNTILMMR